jgi:hypothetical protein
MVISASMHVDSRARLGEFERIIDQFMDYLA